MIVVQDADLIGCRLLLLNEVFVTYQVAQRRLAVWRVDGDRRRSNGGTSVLLGRITSQKFISILLV